MSTSSRNRCPRAVSFLVASLAVGAVLAIAARTARAQSSGAGGAASQPDPALREYLSANGLLNRGMNELAIEEYRKFLAAHGDHEKADVARYGLGVALFRLKRHEDAVRELQPLLDRAGFEFAAEALLIVGQSNFELKNWEGAVAPLTRLAGERSQHDAADDAAAMAVEALYRLDRFDEVDAPWSLFAKNWPETPLRARADYLRGLSLVARKNDADAAKHFSAMRERYPKGEFADRVTLLLAQCRHRMGDLAGAAEGYRTLSARDDDLGADATFGIATVSQQAGDDKAAAASYDRFLEQWPEHASVATAMLERGRLCVGESQFDRARELLRQAAEKDKTRADEAAYWLAKCDLREEKFTESARRLADAIAAHPATRLLPEMMYDRAVALAKAEDAAGAIAALDAFRGKFPEHALVADATALQATLEHQRGGYDTSAALCAAFVQKNPTHDQSAAIAFLAAENDLLREKFEDAAGKYEAFLKAHAQDPQAKTARYRLGSAQFRLQRFDQAHANLIQAVDGRRTEKTYRRGLLMLGDIAFQKEQWEAVVALLGDYLSFGVDQPSSDDAQLKRGIALARMNMADEAAEQFSELLAAAPDSPHRLQALFERGQVLLGQDKIDAAAPLFDEVVKAGDSRFRAFAINHLATIAMRKQDWDRAAELYAQVEQAKPTDAEGPADLAGDAMFHRGQALMASRKYSEAAQAFAALVERAQGHARAGEAQAQRGIALSRSKEHEQALQAIQIIVEQQYADKLPADLAAAVLYEKAWCLRELDRGDEAITAYQALLQKHATDANAPHAMLELAEMQTAAGQHEQAAELLANLRAASKDKNREVAADVRERGLYRLAVSDFELGRFDNAAKNAEAFVAEFAESDLVPSARLFAGEAHFKQSRWEAAGEHFSEITSKFKDDPGCATGLLRLGECQAQLQRWPESEQTFAAYLERFADTDLWFQAQFGLAWARENRGLHDQAMEAYRKIIDRHSGPTAARAQFQIGQCLFAQKKHPDAVRELLKVDILYGYPEWSAAALYEAGRVFEEMGQKDQARAQFQQVKAKYADTEWAKLATQRLAASTPSTGGG